MATDREGWQKRSYDVRGRVLKSSRYLNVKATQYDTQSAYDDADRVTDITYPSSTLVKIHYDFDNAGNITNVVSKAGTGANAEVFYRPLGFTSVGQSLGMSYGNGLYTTNNYFTNSKRIQQLRTSAPGSGWHQNLQYTYDNVSNLKSIVDNVFTTGITSASISSVTYDDLHRLQSLYSTAYGATRSFAHSSIGNILTNGEAVSGSGYFYGAKPHAATNAFGRSYAYDLCGNMTSRGVSGGTQALSYDEENRLLQVSGPGTLTVSFGYDGGGERLWRYSTTSGSYSVWIGGLYEERGGKILCHVFASGRRIATFEPQAGQYAAADKPDRRAVILATINRGLTWPLVKGRLQWTIPISMFCGIVWICLAAGRRNQEDTAFASRRKFSKTGLIWKQSVTFVSLAAFLLAAMPVTVSAQSYSPVFYYYHPDHLGSTTVLTDRSGVRVDICQNTAFGREQYNDPTSAFAMSNRFTGQILDDETGLYYYNARYYDPELGRFIQPDTIVPGAGNPQSLNRYTYVNNNPLNSVDPSGHFWEGVLTAVIYVAVAAAVGAAVGAAISAVNHQDAGAGALNGAISAAVNELGGIVGAIVLAEIRGQDVLKAALIAVAATVITFGVGQFVGAVIGDAVNNIGQATEYAAIQSAAGAATGATGAAIEGTDVGTGAWEGALGGFVSVASAVGGQYAKYEWQKYWDDFHQDWRATFDVMRFGDMPPTPPFPIYLHIPNLENALGEAILPGYGMFRSFGNARFDKAAEMSPKAYGLPDAIGLGVISGFKAAIINGLNSPDSHSGIRASGQGNPMIRSDSSIPSGSPNTVSLLIDFNAR